MFFCLFLKNKVHRWLLRGAAAADCAAETPLRRSGLPCKQQAMNAELARAGRIDKRTT